MLRHVTLSEDGKPALGHKSVTINQFFYIDYGLRSLFRSDHQNTICMLPLLFYRNEAKICALSWCIIIMH